MTNKRLSKEYLQISGYVKKSIALRFRGTCKAKDLEISEVMEELIIKWLEENKIE
jgi:hypothetical protein